MAITERPCGPNVGFRWDCGIMGEARECAGVETKRRSINGTRPPQAAQEPAVPGPALVGWRGAAAHHEDQGVGTRQQRHQRLLHVVVVQDLAGWGWGWGAGGVRVVGAVGRWRKSEDTALHEPAHTPQAHPCSRAHSSPRLTCSSGWPSCVAVWRRTAQ